MTTTQPKRVEVTPRDIRLVDQQTVSAIIGAVSLEGMELEAARHRLATEQALRAENEALREDIAERFAWLLEQAESAMSISAGAATTHGDDSGALEMLNKIASDIGINSQMTLDALTGGKSDDAALAKQGEG